MPMPMPMPLFLINFDNEAEIKIVTMEKTKLELLAGVEKSQYKTDMIQIIIKV